MNLGKAGEDAAAAWLEARGHTILERNWRSGHLEVDLITFDAEGLHMVEVKTRRSPSEAPPQDNVDYVKRRNLSNAARAYLRSGIRRQLGDAEVFFDIIAILYDGTEFEVNYIPKAFIPLYV